MASTSSLVSSSSSSSISNSSLPSSISHQLPIKLSSHNYLLWRAQILSLLNSHDLTKFIDGSYPAPPKLIDEQPNPAYALWFRQDQLVLSWIIGSISETFVAQVVSASTSHLAWSKLAATTS